MYELPNASIIMNTCNSINKLGKDNKQKPNNIVPYIVQCNLFVNKFSFFFLVWRRIHDIMMFYTIMHFF